MKRLFTLFVLALSFGVIHAQNPGQVGTLLKNESTTKSTPKNNMGVVQYNWNYMPVGYAEVFIRIPEGGVFTVTLNNQSITTNNGRFRFFDLQPGFNNYISIQRNGYLMYKTQLNIQNNTRYIIDYFTNQGMYLLNTVPLNMPQGNGMYSDLWNQMWNGMYQGNNGYNFGNNWNPYYGLDYNNFGQNPYGNGYNNGSPWGNNPNGNWGQNPNGNWGNNPNQGGQNPNGHWGNNPNQGGQNPNGNWGNNPNLNAFTMNAMTFTTFKNTVKSQSFDNSRIAMIKQQTQSNNFTASQIKELCDLLSFDNGRLDVAKHCYDFCVDPQNYFVVYGTFDFDSNVKELTKYISGK